ncbi:MAG: hypothetical protein ABJN35_14845 [Erythrobacter sp.]
MHHKNVFEKSGFRTLSEDDLKTVAGGFDVPNGFGGGHIDDYAYLDMQQFMQVLDSVQLESGTPTFGDGDRLQDLLDRLPDVEGVELTEYEQARSYTLQVLGIPGPVADALAVAITTVSSVEFKQALKELSDQVLDTIMDSLFTPDQSTGDFEADLRRVFGPIIGPQSPG